MEKYLTLGVRLYETSDDFASYGIKGSWPYQRPRVRQRGYLSTLPFQHLFHSFCFSYFVLSD